MEQTLADVDMGRMSKPVPVSQLDLDRVLLARRFSREQGLKANGEAKLRAIDDLSANGVNGCAQAEGKTRVDAIDQLVRCAVLLKMSSGRSVAFWKADIDAAFRRVPVQEKDKWAAWVAFLYKGQPVAASHHSAMFGSLGSVHGWDRIGAMICHLARAFLGLPVFRYVDDFFAAELGGAEEHAMQCFARLVRALMGDDALKEEKPAAGESLDVLGLHIAHDKCGVIVRVNDEKAVKWSGAIDQALAAGVLSAGDASKMSGRLSFAAQKTFRRAGRAALRPLFQQQYAPLSGGRIGKELEMSLKWWREALGAFQAQRVPWEPSTKKATLLTDARSTPPRVAAVLIVDGKHYYTDWAPDEAMLQMFSKRNDNQIMGLEILAVVVGICTFAKLLKGRSVKAYCDNVGGERALAAGAARSADHDRMIHGVWMMAMRLGLTLWTERVPTKDNIADLPSRESYSLMEQVFCSISKSIAMREINE
jgi:hypothetical protein